MILRVLCGSNFREIVIKMNPNDFIGIGWCAVDKELIWAHGARSLNAARTDPGLVRAVSGRVRGSSNRGYQNRTMKPNTL